MELKPIPGNAAQLRCDELVSYAFRHLDKYSYSKRGLYPYRRTWKKFLIFAGEKYFSQDLAERFLVTQGIPKDTWTIPYRANSERAGALRAMRMLTCLTGEGSRHFKQNRCLPLHLPDNIKQIFRDYETYCIRHRRYRADTLHGRLSTLRRFLDFICEHNKRSLENLRAEDVSEFLQSKKHMAQRTFTTWIDTLKMFFRYLWTFEITTKDLSLCLPVARVAKDAHIPTVWSREQVDAILSAVDRSQPTGKRNYAILLLACRLGLRAKDIRELKLENFRWAEARLEFIQSKTGVATSLPIENDVGEAIIEYLRHGRPKTGYRELFLRVKAPFEPLRDSSALSSMLRCYLRRAGVAVPRHGHAGMHSFRHTLVAQMLEQNTSLTVVSNILGHTATESVRFYMKVDIASLRSACLNPNSIGSGEVHNV